MQKKCIRLLFWKSQFCLNKLKKRLNKNRLIYDFMFAVVHCFPPPLPGSLVYVLFGGSVRYGVCTLLSAANASEQSLQVCTEQKSTMNESSSAGAGEST